MQDDELVLEGFKGRRGLLESVAPAASKMSFATLGKFANDWIEAMGGKFHQPPDCGCVGHGDYILEFQSVRIGTQWVAPAQLQAHAMVRLEAQDEDAADDEPSYLSWKGKGGVQNRAPL